MTIIRSPHEMVRRALRWQRRGRRIGLVPTMGALHEGHVSLIRRAASRNDVVVVTIFVNPLQFGPREDFTRYPRPFARDARLARAAGAAVLFAPSARDMYPPGFQTSVEVSALARRWEGQARPGHFRGVATVVARLFGLTRPTNAYFGQKDYQQARIIQRLVADLRLAVTVHVLPTMREPDGLAMSSRNAYLTPAERRSAAVLYQALLEGRRLIRGGERRSGTIVRAMRRRIASAPQARLEYAAAADADTLEPRARLGGRTVLLLAVRVGRTRLIDNLLVGVS